LGGKWVSKAPIITPTPELETFRHSQTWAFPLVFEENALLGSLAAIENLAASGPAKFSVKIRNAKRTRHRQIHMQLIEYAKEISSSRIQDLIEYSLTRMQNMTEFLEKSTFELVEYMNAIDYSKLDYTLICIISLFLLNFIVLVGIMSQKSKMSLLDSKLNTLINRPNKTPKIITRSMAPPPPPGPPSAPNAPPAAQISKREIKEQQESESVGGGMSSVLEELSNFKRNVMESYMYFMN